MQAGDFLLYRGRGLQGKLIELGQWLMYPGERQEYENFSHAALYLGKGKLAEALAPGVVATHVSNYDPYYYNVVEIEAGRRDRQQIVDFAQSVLEARWRYGYLTIAGLGINYLTGGKLNINLSATAICSGFVAEALTRAGYVFPKAPHFMMPYDLAKFFSVKIRD